MTGPGEASYASGGTARRPRTQGRCIPSCALASVHAKRCGHVDEYIAEAPLDRLDALNLLRGLCREELPGFDEAMRYGMPSYLRGDAIEVAFASQKASITLYILRRAALAANAERLTGLSVGKGAIRFRRPDQIDPNTVRELLRATVADAGPIC